ncbi:hypothetical protein BGW42_007245 [Actinomortierella wolfii]|nr:hypothetical protein BGW42_007245 [Actinomortierella wolfii]
MVFPFASSNKNKVGSALSKVPAHDSAVDLLKTDVQSEKTLSPSNTSYLIRPPPKVSSEFKVSAEAYAMSRV